jgi:predicted regulator of Ras-like GTPase activity (Roadblock/LC7/MglB family)
MKLKKRLIILFSLSLIPFLIAFNFVLTGNLSPAETYKVIGRLKNKITYSGSRSRSVRIQLTEDQNTYTITSIQTKAINSSGLIDKCSAGDSIQLMVKKKNSIIYNLLSNNKKVIVGLIYNQEQYLDLNHYNAQERKNNITSSILFFILGSGILLIGIFEYRYSKRTTPTKTAANR